MPFAKGYCCILFNFDLLIEIIEVIEPRCFCTCCSTHGIAISQRGSGQKMISPNLYDFHSWGKIFLFHNSIVFIVNRFQREIFQNLIQNLTKSFWLILESILLNFHAPACLLLTYYLITTLRPFTM